MTYDVIVVGSGPGGYVAAIRAAQLGFKTAIIEKDGLGGICLNWGCIPAKALLKSAQVYEDIKNAKEYGIDATGTPDFPALIKRSRNVADKMSRGVEYLMRKNKIDVFRGFGKLVSPNRLEVTSPDNKKQIVDGRHVVIATGARSRELPFMKLDGKKIFGYREALNLSGKPESIIIVGSGAIGVEFAYFFNCFGTKVTIVEFLPRIVPTEDEDISKELEKSFRKAGINILPGSNLTKVDTSGTGVKAFISGPSGEQILEAELLLSAVGIVSPPKNPTVKK